MKGRACRGRSLLVIYPGAAGDPDAFLNRIVRGAP
jgi:hypothetical protein